MKWAFTIIFPLGNSQSKALLLGGVSVSHLNSPMNSLRVFCCEMMRKNHFARSSILTTAESFSQRSASSLRSSFANPEYGKKLKAEAGNSLMALLAGDIRPERSCAGPILLFLEGWAIVLQFVMAAHGLVVHTAVDRLCYGVP